MSNKPGRGGKREGAGRPPKAGRGGEKRIQKSITLPPSLWEWIDRQDGTESDVIERLVNAALTQTTAGRPKK